MPLILYLSIKAKASSIELSGEIVIGLMTIPDSYFFTFSTSLACLSIEKFLWITPMPPNCAIAMASLCSVTVSIAE